MLRELEIKDILLIERLSLEFSSGLNAFTGETGTGKSILLDCLGFVLGARGQALMVRDGIERGEVVAIFSIESSNKIKLILDEATSALDTLSEKAIKKSIDSLKGKITIILIAHRISTIKDADFIYVIEKGNILEKGNYSTLKNKKDSFFNYLISSQKL